MAISLMIVFPLCSFLLLLLAGQRLHYRLISLIGILGIMLSAAVAINLAFTRDLSFVVSREILWQYLPSTLLGSGLNFALYLDTLALVMVLVVTIISTLIAIYSSEYMRGEAGLARFFASMNLFVAFMLLIILADSLWLLFIGWEGVGLCSYLLISFYFQKPAALDAAMKAFLTTRLGDVFLLFGIFLCFAFFDTLNISTILTGMATIDPQASPLITIMLLCFLCGAVGKSAQLPLQTWLADAMWGPTPASALIHAATMVTAGVYLLVRMGPMLLVSQTAQLIVMIVGLSTMLVGAFAACAQSDMKRVLAYSTMSQIGFMFLAVGATAFSAAIFHLMTHAFFKALLFLTAGVIGHAVHSYDLFSMGGLRKSLPSIFIIFSIGAVSLMGLPVISSGFFSKEWILSSALSVPVIGNLMFAGALLATLMTGFYTMRMLALAFFGPGKKIAPHAYAVATMVPLIILAIATIGAGWLQTPQVFGDIRWFATFLSSSTTSLKLADHSHWLWLWPTLAALSGAMLAMFIVSRSSTYQESKAFIVRFIKNGVGFDDLYSVVIIRPYRVLCHGLRSDLIRSFVDLFQHALREIFVEVARLHTGRLNHYISFIIITTLALASMMVLQ